jgi:hypothetical protein
MAAKKTEDCTQQQGQQDSLENGQDKKTQSKGDELLGKLFSNRLPIVHDPEPLDQD